MSLKEKGRKKYEKLVEEYKTDQIAECFHNIEKYKEKIEHHEDKIKRIEEKIEKIEKEKVPEIEIEKMIMNGKLNNLE